MKRVVHVKRLFAISFFAVAVGAAISLVFILFVWSARHHFEYHIVPDRFLTASDMHGTRQFLSYHPFPYTLAKPMSFHEGAIVAFRYPDGFKRYVVKVGKIYSGTKIYIIEDADSGDLLTVPQSAIIAKD